MVTYYFNFRSTVRGHLQKIEWNQRLFHCIQLKTWGNVTVNCFFIILSPFRINVSIIIPVSAAMSDGDVIRLNRMYNCGPEYNTGDNLPAETTATPTEAANSNEKSTIFGMFIFKIIPAN